MKIIKLLILSIFLIFVQNAFSLTEGFESGLPTAYTATTSFTLSSGTWTGQANGVLRGATGVKSGSYSLQLRSQTGAQITSPNITTGVGTVTFWGSSSTTSGSVQVNYSIDGGITWVPATGSPFSLTTGSAVQKTATINSTSPNILVQFYRTAVTVYIDDIQISNFGTTTGSGLIINEVSQGEGGVREYIEMVTVGNPCTTIDIRDWIIDDNNGIFSNGSLSGTGVASGYMRFSSNSLWSAVPIGTIILIYNDSISPYAHSSSISNTFDIDPTDFIISIPINGNTNLYFKSNSISPSTTISTYDVTTYSNSPIWVPIGLTNNTGGDGVQTRKPDITFYHGVGFGTLQNTHPDQSVYGVNALLFPTGGADKNYYFSNNISNDFRDISNWSYTSGSLTRTPGSANNSANSAWLSYLRSCVLPIELYQFTSTCSDIGLNKIYFSTLSQSNVDSFYLQKSTDGVNWTNFTWFKGKEFSSQLDEYRATDDSKYKYYYRIKEVDLDGTIIYSRMIYSNCLGTENNLTEIKIINNNILDIKTNSNEKIIFNLYSIDGKLIKSDIVQNTFQTSLDALSRGIYVASLISESGQINIVEKILIK